MKPLTNAAYYHIFLLFLLITACKNDSSVPNLDNILDIRIKEDPQNINPVLFNGAVSRLVHQYIFLPPADFHPESLDLIPILLDELPETENLSDGRVAYKMKFKQDAVWENGTPVTAEDYLFTLKVIMHPGTKSSFWRAYFGSVSDILISPDDPKEITIIHDEDYMLSYAASISPPVLPRYVYDPEGMMDVFSVTDLKNEKFISDYTEKNEKFASYLSELNGLKYGKDIVSNSGPYKLDSWESNQSLVLSKKENYWGLNYPENPYLQQGPQKMNFYIIPDETTLISQLKNDVLDVSNSISKKRFVELKNDPLYQNEFNFFSPTLIRYYYLLINNHDPILKDANVRLALAYLLDVNKIIENMEGGLGTRISSLVHPKKKYFNQNLEEIPFDPEKAKEILSSSGWKDVDGDGDLDKMINGVSRDLTIDAYISEQELGKYVALLLQESADKIGININIITKPFSTILSEHVFKKEYGITPFVSNLDPGLDDFYSSWHSDNADLGESNFSSYEDEEADRLIEEIRKTKDPQKRNQLYALLQEEVQNDMPVIFLYAPTETIVVSNRWKGSATSKRPGYMANTFMPVK